MSFLRSFARNKDISKVGRRGIHCMQKLCAEKISPDSLEKAQNRVIDAALTLKELVHSLGGAVATSTLLGVPLGHNSSFLEGPAFAPPFIREGIWCGSANSTTEEGKDLKDLRIMVDVGDIPIQEMRDCGIGDERLMKVVSDSVKLVMEEVGIRSINKEGREQAKKFGVEQFEMRHFSKDRPFLENLNLGEGAKGVYISIDVDCLDPGYAVGVSHYESGGLSFRDVMNMLQNLKGDIVGGDVVEYNPQRDTPDRMTAMVAAKFVRELAAKMSK
ncbi:hypothetical protein JHK86_006166 [Glycine max]|nr:hypothetical protein JHK86_006166 [Glycine max]